MITKPGYAGSKISYSNPCAACALRVFEYQEIAWSALDRVVVIYPKLSPSDQQPKPGIFLQMQNAVEGLDAF